MFYWDCIEKYREKLEREKAWQIDGMVNRGTDRPDEGGQCRLTPGAFTFSYTIVQYNSITIPGAAWLSDLFNRN